ncbi:SusC/RagA family TonB-linked outer membrane protein [Fulvivirga sediminis]|uniref:TonB-dependent receptor n=1 Tax=Fulvivirga sediminis TaxID=2803949 RepID=A0A937F5M7_9BACT|nr:TonB-dependent receptor [Fulvivirga sediminis]MBL3655402.1 TonB-dependent receptor [Fulvivirga sediminis]
MKKILLLHFLMLLAWAGYSQTQVSGTVSDQKGEPLPGVSILVKGTTQGTITGINGDYTINVADNNAVLVFSFVGYVTQEIPLNDRNKIDVNLSEDIKSLEEVVVIGYGTQKRSSITGSIASIDSDEITQAPASRIEQSLQGKVAGVQVTSQSGQPGDKPTIRIRGAGTNGSAEPIYIVDGFQVSGIDYLNPGDIAKMDILKDAASAAIYGARGANGVVLITTKSGNGKPLIQYSGYYGVQNAWKKLDVLNAKEYAVMMNEGAANAGRSPIFANTDLGAGTDWQEEVYNKNAPITNHQVTLSGSNDISKYTTALSYYSQEGIVGGKKSKFDRYSARINSDHKVGDKFTFGENISYSYISRNAISANEEFGGIMSNAINLDPVTPVYEDNPDSEYLNNNAVKNGDRYYAISEYIAQEVVNPLARLAVTHGDTRVDKFVGNVYGEYEIIPNLKFRSSFGLDLGYVVTEGYSPASYLNSATITQKASVSKEMQRTFNWQNENTLQYQKDIDDHSFTFLIGNTVREEKYEQFGGGKQGLVVTDPDLVNLAYATDPESATISGFEVENALVSFFGRVIYNYKEKYLLTAIVRRDGSTRFGPDNRYGTFPSLSLGWVASREDFFPDQEVLTFAKLRASWGQNGSDAIGDYRYVSSIATGRGYTFYDPSTGETYVDGASPSFIANPELKWEASEQTDIGLDLGFFNEKLSVNFDYYRKETKDLLLVPPVPGIAGNAAGASNVGGVLNQGIEIAINYNGSAGDFTYSIGGNLATLNNEVLTVDGSNGVLTGASISTYGTVSRMEAGYPIGYFYGYKSNGLFQNQAEIDGYVNSNGQLLQPKAVPGDVRFVDYNNDGVINDDDRTMIGNPHPDITYGFNGSANYKNFSLSFLFNGVHGNEIFSGIRRHDLSQSNMPAYFMDRWTGEGTSNEIPRFTLNDTNENYSRISDMYVESGSFLRLRNVTLGYTLPENVRGPFKSVRIYGAVDNLLTFTNYRGLDPEVGSRLNENGSSNVLDTGIDRGIYPQPRTFRVGVDLSL